MSESSLLYARRPGGSEVPPGQRGLSKGLGAGREIRQSSACRAGSRSSSWVEPGKEDSLCKASRVFSSVTGLH